MIEMCAHEAHGVIFEHAICQPCPSQEGLERWAQWFLGWVAYQRQITKGPGDEGYGVWKAYQTP